jgi:hypothetical protein
MLTRVTVLAVAALAVFPAASRATSGSPRASSVATAAAPAAVIPPDLQALEQKMLQLQITSERFSLTETVAGSGAPSGPLGGFGGAIGHAASTFDLLTATGEASFTPQQASVQISFLGLKLNARLIGTTLYLEEPFIARLDGGRPWVEEPNQHAEQANGTELTPLGGASAAQAFGKLIELLNRARSIQGLGQMTIDGQSTAAFAATLEVGKTLSTLSGARKRSLVKLLQPLARLEVFIAEGGLPVRTRLTLAFRPHRGERGELITQSDILAVNIPVVVQAPPAAETISQAQLKRLLKHRVVVKSRRHRAKSKQ